MSRVLDPNDGSCTEAACVLAVARLPRPPVPVPATACPCASSVRSVREVGNGIDETSRLFACCVW
eukprot:3712127-Prymnesium_polylepis.1